jgi:hypothetical protein
LKSIEQDQTHELRLKLEDGAGFLRMLITLTGSVDYHKETSLKNTVLQQRLVDEYVSPKPVTCRQKRKTIIAIIDDFF